MAKEWGNQGNSEYIVIKPRDIRIPEETGIGQIDYLAQSLHTGAIKKSEEGEIFCNYERIADILQEHIRPLTPVTSADSPASKFQFPEIAEIAPQIKSAVRTAINIIYRKLQLIDSETLSYAVRFAGPGNAVFSSRGFSSLFLEPYATFLESQGTWNGETPLPPPENIRIRDQHSALFMGRPFLEPTATEYQKAAENAEVSLPDKEALKLTMVKVGAHEFAHGIEYALSAMNRSTYDRAKSLPETSWYAKARQELSGIHEEQFAEGVSDEVVKYYASTHLGMNERELTEFFRMTTLSMKGMQAAIGNLIRYAEYHNFSFLDLISTDARIGVALAPLLEGTDREDNNLYAFVAYGIPPYSVQEVKFLTGVTDTIYSEK